MSPDSPVKESGAEQQAAEDAHFSIVPILPRERVWGLGDFTVVNAALAIATWCFIMGGYLAYVVGAKAGIAALFVGLFLGFGLTVLGGSLGSCKYGVDLYVQVRSSFGTRAASLVGVFVCLLMVYLNAAIIYPMLGKGMTNITRTFVDIGDGTAYWLSAFFAIAALLVTWLVVYKGPVYIKSFNWLVAPGLVVVMIILVIFIFRDFGWSKIAAAAPIDPADDKAWNYAIAIEWSLGFAFSWWWIMGALTRITKTQRSAAVGFVAGTGFPAFIAIIIGMMTALVAETFDPTEWLVPIAGSFWGVIALVFIVFANISSGSLMTYSGGIALRNFGFMRRLSWKTVTLLVLSPTIATMFFQDLIYTRLGQVLAVWAVLLAPLTAIVFVDYHLLRRQHLDLRAIYDTSSRSKYYFWKGFNPAFVITLAVSFVFYFWMLNPISLRSSDIFKYTTAALPTFVVAAVVYYAITKLFLIPRGMGAYPELPKEPAQRKLEIERLQQTI